MKRKNSEELKDVIMRFLREEGLETQLHEHHAVKAWPEVAGPFITRYTGAVRFQQGTLYIKITRPALRQDLTMGRTQLARQINERVGSPVVKQIVFY